MSLKTFLIINLIMNPIRQSRNRNLPQTGDTEQTAPFLVRFGQLARNLGDLATDLYEQDGSIITEINLGGVDPKDIKISFLGNYLRIAGERSEVKEEQDRNYFYKEIQKGHFERQIKIPTHANLSSAEATFENGKLIIKIPTQKSKNIEKTIPIKTQDRSSYQRESQK